MVWYDLFNIFGKKKGKKLEPARIDLIRGLEKKADSRAKPDMDAMRTYVRTMEVLEKGKYDISEFTRTRDYYKQVLHGTAGNRI